jgi:hypothetical protein
MKDIMQDFIWFIQDLSWKDLTVIILGGLLEVTFVFTIIVLGFFYGK